MRRNDKNFQFKPLGNHIHDLSRRLEIDELLLSLLNTKGKSGVLTELKLNREKILTFGRQMLTVAITQGEIGLEQKNMPENPWLDMARTGRELEKVMDDFLWTCGGTREEIGYMLKHLRSLPQIMKISSPKNNSTFKGVMKEARNLVKAKGTIRWLASQLEKNRDFIGPRQNPGSPEKRDGTTTGTDGTKATRNYPSRSLSSDCEGPFEAPDGTTTGTLLYSTIVGRGAVMGGENSAAQASLTAGTARYRQ